MAQFDVLIKGGIVIDGTGSARYRADVAIRDGVVAEIGRIPDHEAKDVLDADGLIVAPGFIDLHTHYDAQLFWDPYCSLSGWHGVTSVVIGNCGFGFAPVQPDARDRAMLTMVRTEAIPYPSMKAGMPWDWVTYPEFLDSVDRTPKSVNIKAFLAMNPVLIDVMGFDRAKAGEMPTAAEHRELRRVLNEAMDAGAGGWSVQRLKPTSGANVQRDYDGTPMATDVMHTETCVELAEVLAERRAGFIQMTMAGDASDPMESKRTFELLARVSGRPILYNVVTPMERDPEIHRKTLAWLDGCRKQGLQVYGCAITTRAGLTFTFEDWNLFDEADAWRDATLGNVEERLDKLADPARRAALRDARIFAATGPIANMVVLGPKSTDTAVWKDHTIADVAEATGKHPVDAMLDIAVADRLRTVFYTEPLYTKPELLKEVLDYRWTIPGVSDGGAHTKFLTAGTYPTELIVDAVRAFGILELEEAHWRLSSLPAHCAGFPDRGTLQVGKAADIVVYDYDHLRMGPVELVHDLPGGEWRRVSRPSGYRFVLVNGQVTIDDDKETGVPSGRLLRQR
jgi:N-acyl-D-aspartate/D-glutamate deacylase